MIYIYTVYISYNNDFEAFANGLRCLKYYTRQYFLWVSKIGPAQMGRETGHKNGMGTLLATSSNTSDTGG